MENVTVPRLTGKVRADAVAALTALGLTVGTDQRMASDTVGENSVVATTPEEGSSVEVGSSVSLVLSTGPAEVSVPDVIGKTLSAARIQIEAANLTLGSDRLERSAVPKGQVIATTPPSGTGVAARSTVAMTVSGGLDGGSVGSPSPDKTVLVPRLVGLTQPAAEALLHTAGLVIGAVTHGSSSSVPDDGVAKVDPLAGTPVAPGSAVNICLSTGPKTSTAAYWAIGLGVVVVGLIVALLRQQDGGFLTSLANRDTARGLITFLITFTTIVIAILLAISAMVMGDAANSSKRFDNGKQVLTVLIGILGTIVGFYFGASDNKASPLAIATKMLPPAVMKKDYGPIDLATVGGTTPFKWTVSPDLPSALKLDPAHGIVSGAPAASQPKTSYTFTVSDSQSPPMTAQQQWELVIGEPK